MQEVYFFFRNFHFKKYSKNFQVVLRQLSIHRLASLIIVFNGLSKLLFKMFENNSFNFSDTTARWECILRLSRLNDRSSKISRLFNILSNNFICNERCLCYHKMDKNFVSFFGSSIFCYANTATTTFICHLLMLWLCLD